VVFVVESNHRDAVAPSGPVITPFTLGTATLAGGIASLAMPSGLPLADAYELESFYGGDANYLAGHSASVAPGGGPVAFELAIKDTGVAFRGFPLVRPNGFGAHTIEVLGKVRPAAEIGQPPPTGSNLTSSPAMGGVSGHIKMFLDGVQTTTGGAPSTPQILSNSGSFALGTGPVSPGQHVIVLQYMGDGLDGFLPAGSTTITYTQPLLAGNNAISSPKGSVAFSTAPKSTNGTTAGSTSSDTKSSASNSGLSVLGVDQLFASTTTHQTPRTLAGALAKAHSGEDWLGGAF